MPRDLIHDLVLPTLLFAAVGAMTWAVRGCSGFGAMNGCVFAGVTLGTVWWFISREPGNTHSRPFSSGWIILALTLGIGISGNRGWMQWPSFFEGRLQTNSAAGQFAPIPRFYGFVWLFLAGVPWAGLGACFLAWCGSHRRATPWQWLLRIGCGLAGAGLATLAFNLLREIFLPLYTTLKSQYADLQSNPNLRRLINDNRAAILHLGVYLGFLGFEMASRNWRNVILIFTVGLLNGLGWALCQNWRWAAGVWPNVNFNWWRCWESSAGISIGFAYGIAHFLVNRKTKSPNAAAFASPHPNLERFAAYAGLIFGLGLSIKNGLKGWANIYIGKEEYWNHVLWMIIGPLMLVGFVVVAQRVRAHPCGTGSGTEEDLFPHAFRLTLGAYIIQNIIAQLVTGPHSSWNETAFSIYYLLLFCISAVVLYHFHWLQEQQLPRPCPFEGIP